MCFESCCEGENMQSNTSWSPTGGSIRPIHQGIDSAIISQPTMTDNLISNNSISGTIIAQPSYGMDMNSGMSGTIAAQPSYGIADMTGSGMSGTMAAQPSYGVTDMIGSGMSGTVTAQPSYGTMDMNSGMSATINYQSDGFNQY